MALSPESLNVEKCYPLDHEVKNQIAALERRRCKIQEKNESNERSQVIVTVPTIPTRRATGT